MPFALAQQAEQDVFVANVVMAKRTGLASSPIDHIAGRAR